MQALLQKNASLVAGIGILLLLALGVGGYLYYNLDQKLKATVADLSAQIATLTAELTLSKTDNQMLSEALENERAKNLEFEEQIEELSDVVGDLNKLSKTDPELLQKYSKVYFLNEHYIPELSQINADYLLQKEKDQYFHKNAMKYLRQLMEKAEDDKIDLSILSAFRSFETQVDLKSKYKVTYGTGANQFSADQGYSEHQLGTAVDFTTSALATNIDSFESTPAYEWLLKNAYKYGFVLSYPKDNAYYIFEPWHWRFVGTDLARDLHEDDKFFYDLDQRDIDEYLIKIFD